MSDGETSRLIAWAAELRRAHVRLREALAVAQDAVGGGDPADRGAGPARTVDDGVASDLVLMCHGFCSALDGHHRGEDRTLFPALAAAHPDLAPVLRALEQDHAMIAHLLRGLSEALDGAAPAETVAQHLQGVGAIMENHFRYEERALGEVLERLRLDADVREVLGPL